MAEIIDSTPNAQAYDEEVETLRGRFAANIANIRLFKDNPYLDEMTDEDWVKLWKQIDESVYYYNIEEFQGDEEEWNSYGGEIYGEKD